MIKRALLAGLPGLIFTGASVAVAADTSPKLDDFLSYTFVGELTAPETGDQVAWVELHKGIRNLWTAHSPDFRPQRLTNGVSDDGQELSGLSFSPDGRTLTWMRGAVEHNGWASDLPAANPASAVTQPQMEIWTSVKGGSPKRIAEGEDPVVSNAGIVAYIKDNQVWTVTAANAGKPVKLFYDRGKVGDIAWSPDGTKLVFVSRRGDHSFVGVYSGPDQSITWLAPATAFDDSPVWSPDSKRVAFCRRLGLADVLDSPLVETPTPFEIMVGSVSEEDAHSVWRSPKTLRGSYPGVPDGLFLRWAAGDLLTFRAEMDGWPHLYSVPAAGGKPTLLTPGDYMVEHVTTSSDGRTLFFSANGGNYAGDTDRRHLFRVAVDRPGPTSLTPGTGLEWTPAPLVGGKFAYIAASPAIPPHVMVASAEGRNAQSLDTGTNKFPADAAVTPRPVTFTAPDGLLVHGQLFMPGSGGGKHSALIFVHGGPSRQMLLGWSYMDYYTHSYAMNQYLASHGYVVLSVNYRLGIGYGRAFQHPAKAGAIGNAEYQDVVAGARYLEALPEVDATRIGIWGGSYGGLLTAEALAHNSDIFKAGVDFHGVHDWSLMPGRAAPTRYEQGDFNAHQRLAFESSPEAALKSWRSPVLLIHGDDDRNVRFDQTVDLARRLQEQGTPYQEVIVPNEIHGFLRHNSWERADAAMVRFFDANLKQR